MKKISAGESDHVSAASLCRVISSNILCELNVMLITSWDRSWVPFSSEVLSVAFAITVQPWGLSHDASTPVKALHFRWEEEQGIIADSAQIIVHKQEELVLIQRR